jgi:DNA processing protein
LPDAGDRAVSVVGARDAGPDGLEQARRIGAALARAGAWVVSGGARGIDAAAHSGAVEAGGRTVVVVAGGLDHLYPAENRGLFARVVESGGGLVAECEDGVRPWRWSFPRRNRIVAAIGEATVVVRAGARSGALLTAAEAARIGQRVLVAGGIAGGDGEGLRRLAGSGAAEFETVEGLLGSLGFGAADAVPALPAEVEPGGRMHGLWGALGADPRGTDEVARRAGIDPGAALAGLAELELLGVVERRPGRGFVRRALGARGE